MTIIQHRLKGGAIVGAYRFSFSTMFMEETDTGIVTLGVAGVDGFRVKFQNVGDDVKIAIDGTNGQFVKQISGVLETATIALTDLTDYAAFNSGLDSRYAALANGVPTGGTNGQVLTLSGGSRVWSTPAASAITSVNGATGVVVLDYEDVGADAAGTSYSNITDHEAAGDPHPAYRLTASAVAWADISGAPSTYAPATHAASHGSGSTDPITVAQSQVTDLVTDLAAKAASAVTISAGTGLTGGGDLSSNRSFAVAYGTSSSTACVGDDARLSDSRAPSGSAGGDLTGTYPNPTLVTVVSAASVGAADKTITLTVDVKGRVTAVADTSIAIDGSQVNAGTLPIARIAANAITNAKLAQVATATFKGRTTASTGDVEDLTAAQAAALMPANSFTNAQLATVATATFKGRTTAGTGNVEDLTATQATALLSAVVGDSGSGGTKGLVPAPASGDGAAKKVLQADGTWAYAAAVLYATATFSGTGTHTADMSLAQQQFHVVTVSASTTVTVALSNITANKHISLLIKNTSGGTVTISWPAVLAMGAALPTTIATGKALSVALSSIGTTAGEVYAVAAAQV